MKLTIKWKMFLEFLVMGLIIFVVIIGAFTGLGWIQGEMTEMNEKNLPTSDAITDLIVAFQEKSYTQSMIIEGKIDDAEEIWDEADVVFTTELEELRQAGLISESRIAELSSQNNDLNRYKDGLVTAYQTGGSEAAINSQASDDLDGVIQTMGPQFVKMKEEVAAIIGNSIQATQDMAGSRRSAIIIACVIGFFVGYLAYWLLQKDIINPIYRLVEAAGVGARRDLTVGFEEKRQDEIGQLARSFSDMVSSLRDIVRQVSGTSQGVSFSAQQLASAAQQTNASVQEVSSAIEQVARGAQIQAQRVQQTTSVMEDLGASISEGAQSARAAAEASARASESARTGADSVRGSIDTMDEIEDVTGLTAEAVAKLGQRSEQMTEIVELITSIADQTNLLALNAAIEAARAGEAGKGFAVVAEEVRKLAENSASSATEIGKLIRETTRDTEAAVKNMDAAMAKVKTGKVMITSTGAAFDEIVRMSEDVSGMLQKVSDASSEMSTGAEKVIRSAQDVASIAEETSASTEQASASTQEMVATMEEMASAAASLANMGAELNRLVAEFKTGENTGESRPDMTSPVRSPAGSIKKRFEDSRKRMRMPVQLHALKAEEKNATHSKDGEESDVERM